MSGATVLMSILKSNKQELNVYLKKLKVWEN